MGFPQWLLCKVSSLVFLVSGGNRPVAAVIVMNLLCLPRRRWEMGDGPKIWMQAARGTLELEGTPRLWPQHGAINQRETCHWKKECCSLTWDTNLLLWTHRCNIVFFFLFSNIKTFKHYITNRSHTAGFPQHFLLEVITAEVFGLYRSVLLPVPTAQHLITPLPF